MPRQIPVVWKWRLFVASLFSWLFLLQVRAAYFSDLWLGPLFSPGAYSAILILAAIAVAIKGWHFKRERAGWWFIGAGMVAWSFGQIYFTAFLWEHETPPVPSPADGGFLLLPPLVMVGLVLLWKARLRWAAMIQKADGLIGALAVAALSAAIVFQTVIANIEGNPLAIGTNLAYPATDLVLLAVTVGALGSMGWKPDRVWLLLTLGILTFTLTDSIYLVQIAEESYKAGGLLDSGWAIGILLMTLAAVEREEPVNTHIKQESARVIGVPLGFAGIGLSLLIVGCFFYINPLAALLGGATLVAVKGRLILTFVQNVRLLKRFERESLTDALTSLGNRRALTTALEEQFENATPAEPLVLVLLDLDGFKQYNDTFGHPAGDALLVRVAVKLKSYFGRYGKVFRMGGDEFCVLFSPSSESIQPIVAGAGMALTESGEGFTITCSYGSIVMPTEAKSPEQALAIADKRMYEDKGAGHSRKTEAAILKSRERPHLTERESLVIDVAGITAHRLGFADDQVEIVRHATELRDIGKMSIPTSILEKPGALSTEETELMRNHTVVGERLIASGPTTDYWDVAHIVRASHERWDGTGYPDRLKGESIPLASRIVAVADAMIAMTSHRSYRTALDDSRALAELGRNAGSQFDPGVVETFVQVWTETVSAKEESVDPVAKRRRMPELGTVTAQ